MAPTDSGIISSDYYQFYPSSGFKDPNNPLQITIAPSFTQYTCLQSSFLYIKLKFLKADGSSVGKEQVGGMENFYSASLNRAKFC